MKRGYTALEYKSIIRPAARSTSGCGHLIGFHRRLSRRDGRGLRADPEAGRGHRFRSRAISFMYSPRPGTPAASLRRPGAAGNQAGAPGTAAGTLDARRRRSAAAWSVSIQRILVEGPRGRIPENWPAAPATIVMVNFPGPPCLIGQIIDVHITTAMAHTLRGEMPADRSRLKPFELSFYSGRQRAPGQPVRRARREPQADRNRARRVDCTPRRALQRLRQHRADPACRRSIAAFLCNRRTAI